MKKIMIKKLRYIVEDLDDAISQINELVGLIEGKEESDGDSEKGHA